MRRTCIPSAPPADLHPDAVPYWRAGLRLDDALTAARVAARHARELRDGFILAMIEAGHAPGRVATTLGLSLATVRRAAARC